MHDGQRLTRPPRSLAVQCSCCSGWVEFELDAAEQRALCAGERVRVELRCCRCQTSFSAALDRCPEWLAPNDSAGASRSNEDAGTATASGMRRRGTVPPIP